MIEDDEHIAQSIQFFLEGEGFQIKVAAMARQAMELLKSEDFQLVILAVSYTHLDVYKRQVLYETGAHRKI